jgi:predicted nucleic acid-binding Zn ribbon protein
MPSQQFECATCQQLVIVHREISDDNRPICIACGQPMTRNDGLTHVNKT